MRRGIFAVIILGAVVFGQHLWFYPGWRNDIPGNRGAADFALYYQFGKMQVGGRLIYEPEPYFILTRQIEGRDYTYLTSELWDGMVSGKYLVLDKKGIQLFGRLSLGAEWLLNDMWEENFWSFPEEVRRQTPYFLWAGLIMPGVGLEYVVPGTNIGLSAALDGAAAIGKNYPADRITAFASFAIKFKIF